jgi:CheY-like chemotaxis protein
MGDKRQLQARVRLIHWKPEEAQARIAQIETAGFQAEFDPPIPPELLRRLHANPPAAVVIDLTRLPSHGREFATALRGSKATRHLPVVFAEGDPAKVERIRALLPDAVYTSWSHIGTAIQQAIATPPEAPVVPAGMMERYGATPLPKKLGIKPGWIVALVEAPRGFEQTLSALPEGATLEDGLPRRFDLAIWFVRSVDDLRRGLAPTAARLGAAPLWIAWPKKASGVETDLTQQLIRETGLDAGLVDYKICSIDATWSGLAFVRRKG